MPGLDLFSGCWPQVTSSMRPHQAFAINIDQVKVERKSPDRLLPIKTRSQIGQKQKANPQQL